MTTNKQDDRLEKIRHSLSHIMSMAILELYPKTGLGMGPAIDDGFYQDYDLPENITEEILPKIEKRMKEIIKQKIDFVEKKMSFDDALKFYKNDPYKTEIIADLKEMEEKEVCFYTSGDFDNLCKGPHVNNSSEIDFTAFKLTRIAGAYWKGDEKNKMLTRIYGIAFENKAKLKDHINKLAEAEKRDHNKLGKELDLFITSKPVGAGLPLLTPKGTTIMKELQRWVEDEEQKRGYQQTMTPILAKKELYQISGHWDIYREGMFIIGNKKEGEMALRPMTCPFQFMIYKSKKHSYRELPIRYSETSPLFRKESSGEMHGLIRLSQFTLSEGHLICREDQLEEEFEGVLDLIKYIMDDTLRLTEYWYRFSKWDPKNIKGKYIDNPKAWEESQKVMKKILDKNKMEYVEAEGEAAFYGPKLDIQMRNVHGKEDTIITVQIDFALPEKFDLTYTDENGKDVRPTIIHRSSIGAYERTLALLIEKYAGAFPTWLSPVQALVIPVAKDFNDYAEEVKQQLFDEGIRVEVDSSEDSLGKKIRNGEKQKSPYILVVGEKEVNDKAVAVRKRGQGDQGAEKVASFIKKIKKEIEEKKQ
jgi:threonyl-tRNA synthetase